MGGMAAAAVMAVFSMVAAAADLGLYGRLYLVTAIVEPGPLQVSMAEAEAGTGLGTFLEVSGASAGLAVHLGIGAGFGAVFALGARLLRLRGLLAVAAGALYGLGVMALMGLVVLPAAAGQTAGGQLIADTPELLGWPVFAAEHLLFGLGLGVWTAVATRDRAPAVPDQAAP
jgi:hypothetical protein